MARIFAILLTLMLLPSLAVAQKGRGGGGEKALQTQVDELIQLVSALETEVSDLVELLDGVSREVVTVNDYRTDTGGVINVPTLVFSGMNVQIVNGEGRTNTANGAGNLIVGYNLGRPEGECPDGTGCNRRWGSHMLVSGTRNNYTAFGGLLVGSGNETSGDYSSVSGGSYNKASGFYSSVSGGELNTASGESSSVSGGIYNTASGFSSSVSGGAYNIVSGSYSSVSGGSKNTAIGESSSVSGGYANTASGYSSSVSGGLDKTASFEYCVVGDDGNDC